ncbi:hypothetical protein HRV97_09070 [Sphingomonas sp. HHU CXW]|jgi:hypothetical protein|uniref:Uncharacterized protein n=1 Tax=Sphingomonas hominis TaxID=2741495 RepID=A0ABX2JLL0_9SPHN|nr:hypothetical protein [Sphingomonas hominis]NTS65312.1 hypothetical protein [Sphingomonas hominis]
MDEKGAGGALVLRGGKLRPVQRASVKRNGFSQAGRARFIEVLAATCNVKLATDASGVCGSAIYNTRRRDPAFAADWDAALASGYDRLEAEALRYALERLPVMVDPGAAGESDVARDVIARSPAAALAAGRASEADLRFVLAILNRYAGAVRGERAIRQPRPSEADTDARLTALLDTLERQMAR